MKKGKIFLVALVTFLFVGVVSLVAQEEQKTWWKESQTVTPKGDGAYEVETSFNQCFYVGNFSIDKDTINTGKNKGKVKSSKVTNGSKYEAKAYINGTLTTFRPGETRHYSGDVSVEPC